MAEGEVQEVLEEARTAEEDGAHERAAELYQTVIDRKPYSESARIAGERLREIEEESNIDTSKIEGSANNPERPAADESEGANDWRSESIDTCPSCGEPANYRDGQLHGHGPSTFDPDGGGMFEVDSKYVYARVCVECGYLEPYVENPEDYEE